MIRGLLRRIGVLKTPEEPKKHTFKREFLADIQSLVSGPVPPVNIIEGTVYYDTTTETVKVWDGKKWVKTGEGLADAVAATKQFRPPLPSEE